MKAHHTIGLVTGYVAIGVAVAVWSAHRGDKGKPHFQGIGSGATSAASGLAQTILLWPVAAISNFTATTRSPAPA